MKKIFAIALTVVMLVAVLAVNAFAAADDTKLILEIGDVFGDLVQSEAVDVVKGGEFTLTATAASALSTSSDGSFICVKTTPGNVSQPTKLPDGTTVTVTALELDGTKVNLDASKCTSTVTNGIFNGNNGVLLLLKLQGENALTGDVPATFTTVKVTITVNNPEAPADDTPAGDDTPADDTPAGDDTPADTGIVLAVVPAIVAMAAVAVSKKH